MKRKRIDIIEDEIQREYRYSVLDIKKEIQKMSTEELFHCRALIDETPTDEDEDEIDLYTFSDYYFEYPTMVEFENQIIAKSESSKPKLKCNEFNSFLKEHCLRNSSTLKLKRSSNLELHKKNYKI